MKVVYKAALSFDDVLLEPQFSNIDSREEIKLESKFLGFVIRLPIISSNMDYVTGPDMATAMWYAGAIGILHRFASLEEQEKWIKEIDAPRIISLGAREPKTKLEWLNTLMHTKYEPEAVCIDVAHGHMSKVVGMVMDIKNSYPNLNIIAGNVATAEAFYDLSMAGVDAIKVGIGPGAACTTRVVTGVGVPQLQAILDCAEQKKHQPKQPQIIADGGIRTSGDIVKALSAGADFVMLGHVLAGAKECPGPSINAGNGKVYRYYRGQSIFGVNGERYTKEGVTGFVEEKGPVAEILKQLAGGIKSGMSYVGARNLEELREKAVLRVVSSASLAESHPRIQQVL